jgi:hypothetical protein
MDTIQIEEMGAGADDSTVWVSLGFKSDISPFDVLFIVCAKEKSERHMQLGLDTLYFERFNQAMSCYGGSDKILVEPAAITMHFTSLGMTRMRFSETVRFDTSAVPDHHAKVREHLQAMKDYRWGSVISESTNE